MMGECVASEVSVFNITHDIHGEARIVERTSGIGRCTLAEAMAFVSERLEREAT